MMISAEAMGHSTRLARVLGDIDVEEFGDPTEEIDLFAGCHSVADVRTVLREQVKIETSAMLELVAEADAFDVIELMRMREFPPVPDPRVTMPGGSALAVEMVAAVLLSRSSRKPSGIPREETRPHEQIEELHMRAKRLARLATYRQQYEAYLSEHVLARLASEYQGAVLNIRNLQYDHIRDEQERRLFQHPVVEGLMHVHLGYGYDDVVNVREALKSISGDRMTSLRDETGDIVLEYQDVSPEEMPAEVIARFREAMIDFMFLPGERATIYAAELAEAGQMDETKVLTVLNSYSQVFDDSISAEVRVFNLLTGTNPFLTTPLVADGAGGFASTVNDPGLDSLRRILERTLAPHSSDMRRYDQRARQPVSEGLAIASLERVLGHPVSYSGFHYYAPKKGRSEGDLDARCITVNLVADRVEGDGLFLIDDVAIIVEVKAKSVANQSRRGDVRRLESDLKATIGDANNQSIRLQRLIEANGGIWLTPDSWLELSQIREVRSVVVLVDDVGPLGVAIGDLQAAGLLAERRPPWVASLHDLMVIAEICDRPSEFLLYLRRRTDTGVATFYRGVDELDLFMLFLEGNLYVDDDPDEVRREHASAPPVKTRDRRRRNESAVGTMVTDHCQPLSEWYLRDQIPESEPQPGKPTFNIAQEIIPIIDSIADLGDSGWLRCTTDLLGLAGETQTQLIKGIRESHRRASADGDYHDMLMSFAGMWGHPTVFVGIAPRIGDKRAYRAQLSRYMRVKSYQLQSDRAYGLLFDIVGNLLEFIYLTSPTASDPELDRLVGDMGLQPVGRASRPTPPSARRSKKRLRGKNKRR
ncbi:hypothetical protein [Leucobacter chinensis]|uniref:hypothetical protein n=1 Tax=Leucobacter chinensis TaxID=2851010 RepID=UPI001C24E917|nr:hypothetical protein [Leucobacter chinensis]